MVEPATLETILDNRFILKWTIGEGGTYSKIYLAFDNKEF
jgi:hypothetical protein